MHHQSQALPPHLQDTENYIIAHMSTPEVEELARIQGGKIMDEATGYPSFLPLGEILGHKRMAPYVDNFKREYMSQNANAHQGLEGAIRRSGRYGDTEAVILPRHLADIFDNLLYGGKQPGNPHTGKREYFLGGLLNSIGNFFKPVMSAVSPVLNKIGSGIQSAASGISNALFNTDPASIPSMAQQAFAKAAPAIGQMASPLISQGISALGSRVGLPPALSQTIGQQLGNTAGGLLQNLGNQGAQSMAGGEGQEGQAQQPQSSLDILRQGAGSLLQKALPSIGSAAQQGVTSLGNRIRPGMGTALGGIANSLVNNMGGSLAQNLQEGQAPSVQSLGGQALNTFMDAGRSNLGNIQNPMARMAGEGALNTLSGMQGGASPMEALQSGMSNISPETMQGAQNYAQSGISSLLDSILPSVEEALPMAEEALPLLA